MNNLALRINRLGESMLRAARDYGSVAIQPLARLGRASILWWIGELQHLIAAGVLAWLRGDSGVVTCVMALRGAGVELVLQAGSRVLRREYSPTKPLSRAQIDTLLMACPRGAVVIFGIKLERSKFFIRKFELPVVVAPKIHEVALAEIERKTPFKPTDIHHSETFVRSGADPQRLLVTQCIVKNPIAEATAAELGIPFSELSFIESEHGLDDDIPRVVLKGAVRRSWPKRVAALLALTAMCTGAAGVAANLWRYQEASSEISVALAQAKARLAAVSAKAAQVKGDQMTVAQLYQWKAEAQFLHVWEQASRIFPNESYLSEMRLAEGPAGTRTVSFVGFSPAAAELVPLLDRSPLFERTKLSAAVTPDAAEGRERFSLEAGIRTRSPANQDDVK